MEFPELGSHCRVPSCKQLDFLPIQCDACGQKFCTNHYSYASHNCPSASAKDVQVPVCPLCNQPVACSKDESPDVVVSAHIDRNCQSDAKRSAHSNRCTLRGCHKKELVPVLCSRCRKNFCIQHRHPEVHKCTGSCSSSVNQYNPSEMDEDADLQEAIRRSLMVSANGTESNNHRQTAGNSEREGCMLFGKDSCCVS